jgi:GAF domain-containing protein
MSMAGRPGVNRRAAGVILSRKGAKSRTGGRKLCSTGTKAKTRASGSRELRARLEQQFEACRRELAEARERLAESVGQQAATSEVLRIISNSPTAAKSALAAIAESAARLLDVTDAQIMRVEGDALRAVAKHGRLPNWRGVRPINRNWVAGRAVVDRTTVQVADLQAATSDFPQGAADAKRYGHRTTLATPLLRKGNPIGVIVIRRTAVRPLTEKETALLEIFADQAVIAIENARLFDEAQKHSAELNESLQQQTATADVLKVISRSPGELEPVFNSMLENAVSICEASFGNLLLYDGSVFRHVALHNAPQAWAAEQQRDPVPPRRAARVLYRVVDTKQVTHIADMAAENPDEPIATIAGARTVLIVPMLKENALIGVIAIYRQEVRPFTDKQIALVENFANQAVIAIENARLLNELRESLQQQTATADVLKVISSSPGELEPVFQAMLANATRICGAEFGVLNLNDGDLTRVAAVYNVPPALAATQNVPFRPYPSQKRSRRA